ncbi:hypothetical protein [Oerskovia enterophila]|uniref:hypothetical protein n=1 Tax=Oerskovia enterophila TaxID=43678 RepID=UPI00339AEE37
MSSRDLIGYAVLRANFDARRGSYIENFSEFALFALSKCPDSGSEADVAKRIRRDFGLVIPDAVVGKLLRRGVQRRKVLKVSERPPRYAIAPGYNSANLEAKVTQFNREQRELVDALTAYVTKHHETHAELLGANPAESLTSYIERNAGAVLSQVIRGAGIVRRDNSVGADYLIASFIDHIDGTDSRLFGILNRLIEGVVVASMVEVGSYQPHMKLDRLELVLDTPVVLSALGVRGEDAERSIRQALDLAKRLGAKVSIFEHTRTESLGVIEAAANALRGHRRGSSGDVELYFRQQQMSPADAAIKAGCIDKDLGALDIAVRDTPGDYHRYGLDEDALEKSLEAAINYKSDQARLLDAKSLAAIHRMRHGQSSGGFERCKAVLVTDNFNVVKASTPTGEQHDWPLAMSDSDLVNLLWLKTPDIGSEISRRQLVAVAHAGMRPSESMWGRYLEEIERLERLGSVDPQEAEYLRTEPSAQDHLMSETAAGTSRIDAGVVGAIKQALEHRIEQPLRDTIALTGEALTKAEAERAAAVAEASERALAHDSAARRADAVELERDAARTELLGLRGMREAQIARVRRNVRVFVKVLQFLITTILLAPVFLYAVSVAAPTLLPWASAVSAVALLLIAYALQAFNIVPAALVRKCEEPLVRWRIKRLGIEPLSQVPNEDT